MFVTLSAALAVAPLAISLVALLTGAGGRCDGRYAPMINAETVIASAHVPMARRHATVPRQCRV